MNVKLLKIRYINLNILTDWTAIFAAFQITFVPGIPDLSVPLGLAQDLPTLTTIPKCKSCYRGHVGGLPQKLAPPPLVGMLVLCDVTAPYLSKYLNLSGSLFISSASF